MNGFQEFFQNIGNMISNAFSSIGNFLGIGGSGSGGGGGSASNLAASATLAAGVAMTPAAATAEPVAAPLAQPAQQMSFMPNAPSPAMPSIYPSPATNPHVTNSVPNQVVGGLNSGASVLLGKMGVAGEIIAPIVRANISVIGANQGQDTRIAAAQAREAAWQANANGALSMNPPGTPPGPPVNVRGQFAGNAGGTLSERLIQAKHDGSQAMIERGTNQAIRTAGIKALEGIYTPKGNGGAFGDAMNKIFRR